MILSQISKVEQHQYADMDIKKFRNRLMVIEETFKNIKHQNIEEETPERNMILDLRFAVEQISTVFEVYERQGSINHGYASEKLKSARSIIEHTLKYFDNDDSSS